MKNLVMMCLVFCSVSTITTAQTVTEENLQGSWKMTDLMTQGIHLDIEKKEVNIPQEIRSQLPPESLQQIETNMKEAASTLNTAYMHVDNSSIRQVMGPQEDKGTYKLVDKDNKQFLAVTLANGQIGESEIAMVDNKLQVTQNDGVQVVSFLYTKQ